MNERLREIVDGVPGRVGLAVRALPPLPDAEPILINADEPYCMASVFKVPVLVELMRQAEQGKFALSDRVTVAAEHRSPGSGVLRELDPGATLTVKDLATLMIILSDNTAADYCTGLVGGPRAVTRAMKELGLDGIELNEDCLGLIMPIYGFRPEEESPTVTSQMWARLKAGQRDFGTEMVRAVMARNVATPAAMMELFIRLEQRTLLSKGACDWVLDILSRQQLNQRLPALLPDDPNIRFAHKTGTLGGSRNDCGILYLAGGPVVICAMVKDLPITKEGFAAADRAMAEAGLAVYQAFI